MGEGGEKVKKISNKKGFTLIELVVVMAIIAVLAVLVVGAILVARNTAKETANRSSAKSIQTGLEALYSRARAYNADPDGTGSLVAVTSSDTCAVAAPKLGTTVPQGTTTGGGCAFTALGTDTYTIAIYRADGTTVMENYQQQ